MASNTTSSTNEHIIEIVPAGLTLPSSCPTPTNNTSDRAQASLNDIAAPKKELIMCAVKLAVLEKLASWLGVLGFMVATVVLLGGLVTMLEMKDFVLISLMLFIEGILIIFRMHYSQQLMMPIICFINSWFQLVSAIIISALSAMRLASQDFGKTEEAHKAIRDFALNFFMSWYSQRHMCYKKDFFEWKVSYCKLLKKVNNECGLSPSDMVSIERFFNDAYSKSVTGSIFDALKMDITFNCRRLPSFKLRSRTIDGRKDFGGTLDLSAFSKV